MKVKISRRTVYHKVSTVYVDVPSDVEDIDEYLLDNQDTWVFGMVTAEDDEEYHPGLGVDGGEWTDIDQDDETRYDCEDRGIGGHL